MSDETATPMTTRVSSPAQVLLCRGCCCGRPDRGYPEVPVDRIKAAWKAEKLNRAVQLTISGCLGPCDLPNVAVLVTPEGMTWYGLIQGDGDYEALVDWARARKAGGGDAEPAGWTGRAFERFAQMGGGESHPPPSNVDSNPGALPPGTMIRSPGNNW